MPTAKAVAPNGQVLSEFSRARGERARLSAKGHQIQQRRLTETDFETVYKYPAGTRIVCDDGQSDEVWDGREWKFAPTGEGG